MNVPVILLLTESVLIDSLFVPLWASVEEFFVLTFFKVTLQRGFKISQQGFKKNLKWELLISNLLRPSEILTSSPVAFHYWNLKRPT